MRIEDMRFGVEGDVNVRSSLFKDNSILAADWVGVCEHALFSH